MVDEIHHALLRCEDRTVVEVVDIGVDITAKLFVNNLRKERRQHLHVLACDAEHALGHLAVGRGAVILVPVGQIGLQFVRIAQLFFNLHRTHAADKAPRRRKQFDRSQESLRQILPGSSDRRHLLDSQPDLRQRIGVSLLGQRVLLGPGLERSLLRLLAGLYVEFLDAARHTDRILPVVRRTGVFRGILDADGIAREHVLPENGLPLAADEDPLGILDPEQVVDLVRGGVTLRRAGESHDHGKVALVVTVERDLEELLGLVGDIFGRIVGRTVVLAGIDAEDREIARMTRPHPVVGVAAELADRRGGRTHQTHVRIDLHDEGEELVSAEERLDGDLHVGVLLAQTLLQGPNVLTRQPLVLLLRGDRGDVAHHFGRDVRNLADEAHLKAGSRELLLAGHGPEAVLQVVVFDRREALDRAVTAVVVRKEQAFGGDDLARAATAEDHDGILQRGVVDAVDLLGGELAAALLHLLDVHLLKVGQQPHAFIGSGGEGHPHGRCE